jgi:prepilin-type N-terminal cleavage/methylation domain-containing protein
MLKKGFTLAEVLVTLGIVGVVAALTIPTLQANVQRQQIGPAVAKAVNTMENTNRLALVQSDAGSLVNVCGTNYIDCLQKYASGGKKDDNTFITDDGITFVSDNSTSSVGSFDSDKYSGTYYTVTVDINGAKNPNLFARDQFSFLVDSYGSVIGYGSKEYSAYITAFKTAQIDDLAESISNNGSSSNSSVSDITNAAAEKEAAANNGWEKSCPSQKTISTDNETNKYCTGAIMDNGYNVLYKL